MSFNNGDEASFFKILLSVSVDYLQLPPAFGKKYLGKANNRKQTLFVMTKSAVKWSLKYVKIEDKYYFMDGWLKFVKDNRLQMGDFLVFLLRSSSPNVMFQVFVFAPSGCLKHPISSSGDGLKPSVKKEENNDDEEDEDEDENKDFLRNVQSFLRRVIKKSYMNRLPLTNQFLNTTGIDAYESVQLRNDEGKTWKVGLARHGGEKGRPLPLLTRGWSNFRKANEMEFRDICEITHVKGNLLHVHVINKKKRGNSINNE